MANAFIDWTSRPVIARRIAEEQRHPVESWNERTTPEDYNLSIDMIEAGRVGSLGCMPPAESTIWG